MAEYERPTSDFVTSTLSGAIAAGDATATIGTGLDIPATNGILQIDYDSSIAVGSDDGPETIAYATYTSATGALAGMTRGLNGTTGVAHANGAKVQCGFSVSYFGGGMIKNDDLETTAGEPGGAWKTYTPALTNITLGAGNNQGYYTQVGKTIHFRVHIVLGAGCAVAANCGVGLPVTASANIATSYSKIGLAHYEDTGTTNYQGVVSLLDVNTVRLYVYGAAGTYLNYTGVTNTVPHTWATTDIISIAGTYEAA